jgi:hypothetical protein
MLLRTVWRALSATSFTKREPAPNEANVAREG